MKLSRVLISILIIFELLLPNLALAQSASDCNDQSKPTSIACIPQFLGNIAQAGIILAGVAAVFLIAFSGLKFLTSGGDPLKVESAKKTMTYTIIGLVLILGAYFIIKLVANATSTDCKSLGIGC